MKEIVVAAALAAIVGAPAFAQSSASPTVEHRAHSHATRHAKLTAESRHRAYPADAYGAATSFGSPVSAFGAERAQDLHECSALEQSTSPTIRDSNWSMFRFRACMNEHGQPE
jgi:hypothetical protein